jgi:hypothetical protein
LPRSIRILALAGIAAAAIAISPAAASADTTASPPDLNFGSLPVGTQSATQVVTLTQSCDVGDIPCLTGTVGDAFSPVINATGGFVPTSSCPVSIIALIIPQSCTIDVAFVPGVVGQITGLLNTGSGGPTVALSGTGTPPTPTPGSTGVKRRKCKKQKKHRSSASVAKKKNCKKRKRR